MDIKEILKNSKSITNELATNRHSYMDLKINAMLLYCTELLASKVGVPDNGSEMLRLKSLLERLRPVDMKLAY